ncbi:MAG: hypothetical protein KC643_10735 [Nitrospira sp.]|nr:hypothetical protein [Nitrospira sp.]MDR4486008.1 polymorphic toxin type 46 domain-containing protein [Nitrospirales bacterium]
MAGYRTHGFLESVPENYEKVGGVESYSSRPGYSFPGPIGKERLSHEQKELLLDLGQFTLDIIGFFEPTPFADGTNSLISLGRGDWMGAGLSILGVIPYIGDLAKPGKLPRYGRSLSKAIAMAKKDIHFANQLRPVLQKLMNILENVPLSGLPADLASQFTHIKNQLRSFIRSSAIKKGARGSRPMSAKVLRFEEQLTSWLSKRVSPQKTSRLADYVGQRSFSDTGKSALKSALKEVKDSDRFKESKVYAQGRDLLTKLRNKPAIVQERIAEAGEFFMSHGFEIQSVVQALRGIDFSKQVVVRSLKGSKEIFTQGVQRGEVGNWFSKAGYSFHDLGIAKGDRVYSLFIVKPSIPGDINVLESYASPVMDFWTTQDVSTPTGGGAIQYVIPKAVKVLDQIKWEDGVWKRLDRGEWKLFELNNE